MIERVNNHSHGMSLLFHQKILCEGLAAFFVSDEIILGAVIINYGAVFGCLLLSAFVAGNTLSLTLKADYYIVICRRFKSIKVHGIARYYHRYSYI